MASLKLDYTRYYRYHALVEALENFCLDHPELTRLFSLGKSSGGRDLWCMELTNHATGKAEEKAGFYLDGNTHAGEVAGSMACLYTIDYLLSNYGEDTQATWLLDHKTFYIIPRVSPDGAEFYLTTPYTVRSSDKEFTFPAYADPSGLVGADLDGDGLILQMRVRDDLTGSMKISEKDPRLMIKRRPDDFGGAYYNVYTEGTINQYNGYEIKMAPNKWGLDFNRNYPINWKPPYLQNGAGPRPNSEPETQAITDFLLKQKNLAGCLYYHTAGGEHLRAFCIDTDDKMNPDDLTMYTAIGSMATGFTDYPVKSLFADYCDYQPQWGTFLDMTFTYIGMFSYATELWDLLGRAGMKNLTYAKMMKMTPAEQEEMQLKLLKWNDDVMAGDCFIAWHEFEHPQFGKVEIGGWNPKFGRQNPPAKLLQEECHKNMLFSLSFAAATPGLAVRDLTAEKISEGIYQISGCVENTGFMPTSGTLQAVATKMAATVKATLSGGQVLQGEAELDLGHLKGHGNSGGGYGNVSGSGSRKKVAWIIQADAGSKICVTALAPRAGKAVGELVLA
ncbi:MAG: M14 family metallopeptidase [Negativicutes bacterium]|nr:M14 family metallopeptidase [Negativicutes bacterium]